MHVLLLVMSAQGWRISGELANLPAHICRTEANRFKNLLLLVSPEQGARLFLLATKCCMPSGLQEEAKILAAVSSNFAAGMSCRYMLTSVS